MRVPTGRLRIVTPLQDVAVDAQDVRLLPGHFIRDQRQARGMSVEQLAFETKIPRSSILALEANEFSVLPGPVFVRGFFRCCARSLAIEEDYVLALLHEYMREQQLVGSEPPHRRPALRVSAPRQPPPATASTSMTGMTSMTSMTGMLTGTAAGSATNLTSDRGVDPASTTSSAPSQSRWFREAWLAVDRWLASITERLGQWGQPSRRLTWLVMWVAVIAMLAVIVMTAFLLAGGAGPSLPQS